MPSANTGDTVKVDYIAMSEGKIFNTSLKRYAKEAGIYDSKKDYAPMCFRIGETKVIEGFNEAVIGMLPGEEKTVAIHPGKAYGEYNHNLIRKYPKRLFESQGIRLEPSMSIKINLPSGPLRANVISLDDSHVTMDHNHAYAGKTLIFKIIMKELE